MSKGDKAKILAPFLNDLFKIGSVKGFKYCTFYMRGREELLVTVVNEPLKDALPASADDRNKNLPRNQDSLMLSGRTQRRLSGYGYIDVGLPPASPSDREVTVPDDNLTTFLVAAYARYGCPYVWVRTNHERLIRLSREDTEAKDNPLRLKATSDWTSAQVKIWDIVAEIVEVCTEPAPANPFEIDMLYFESLVGIDQVLGTGAMLGLLQRIVDSGVHSYDSGIQKDMEVLAKLHFSTVERMGPELQAAHATPS